jgi:uncharacterized membrane protein YdjX (TVP38/TMEM64 family)
MNERLRDILRRYRFLLVAGFAVLGLSAAARYVAGIGLDPYSLQGTLQNLGSWAPLAYLTLMVLRMPLGLPSPVILMAGGILFGTLTATFYGGIGIALSGLGVFVAARWSGRETVERHVPERLRPILQITGSRTGALFMAVGTGYPVGPITAYHAVAGVSEMSLPAFGLAVTVGALIRAGTYTYFGSSLLRGDLTQMLAAAFVLTAVLVVPLLFAPTRRWLAAALRRSHVSTER